MVAALMPAGKAVTKSAARTPSGESSRQRPGKSSTGGVFPTHRPSSQPTPVVILTFCSRVKVTILKPQKKNLGYCQLWKSMSRDCVRSRVRLMRRAPVGSSCAKIVQRKTVQNIAYLSSCLFVSVTPRWREIGDQRRDINRWGGIG